MRYLFVYDGQRNPTKTAIDVINFILLIIFPIFAHIIVHHHRNQLGLEKYQKLYGPLFNNLYFHSQSVFFWVPVFCAARFSLAFTTAVLDQTVVPYLYALFYWYLTWFKFHLIFNPMKDDLLNLQERFYILVIYFYAYFMFIFTPWIPDVQLKYEFGK